MANVVDDVLARGGCRESSMMAMAMAMAAAVAVAAAGLMGRRQKEGGRQEARVGGFW